jgi:hypothetical protein
VLAVLAGACSSSADTVRWRGLTVSLPTGWTAFEQTDTVLGIADAQLDSAGDRGARGLAVQFTHEPRTAAQDWRDLIEQEGGTLEVDEDLDLDGVPSTRLVFSWVTNGVPTREMVVVVPARGIVILLHPVVQLGETDGPQRFLDNRDVLDTILAGINVGAPVP